MFNKKNRPESGGGECSTIVSSYKVSNYDWYSEIRGLHTAETRCRHMQPSALLTLLPKDADVQYCQTQTFHKDTIWRKSA